MATPEITRDKAAAFEKLFGKRITDIVDKVQTLGNLSNPYNYTFTEERIKAGFVILKKELADCEARFEKGLRDQPLVGTGRRKATTPVTETAPVQQQSEEPDTVAATASSGSPDLAETTSALVDEAKQAERDEMKRIEEEDVPAFLKKQA